MRPLKRIPGQRRRAALLVLSLAGGLMGAATVTSVAHGDRRGRDADKEEEEEVDYLGLGARLFKDGHYERAEATLREVDEKKEGADLPRLYTLRGLIYLKTQRHEEARDNFLKAIKVGQTEPVVYVYLAQAHFGLKEFAPTLQALDKAGPLAKESPGLYMVRAQCHWELEQHPRAIQVLNEGAKRFPGEAELPRRHFMYLVDLGLYQEALVMGQDFVKRKGAVEDDFVAVGEALRQAHQYGKAELILEAARLQFPQSERLTILLSHTYLAHDKVLSAAMLFEEATYLNQDYALEAAELYNRAKRFERALQLNARVLDQKAKMKQRMSILLSLERFEMVAAMAPNVSRLGLLEQEDIRYAMAYAYFKTGDFSAAERELKYIQSAEVFNSANELRKMMQTCREAGWECL